MGISRTTLLRLEKGDPGAGAEAYLTALLALGVLDQAAPALPLALWQLLQQRMEHNVALLRSDKAEDFSSEHKT